MSLGAAKTGQIVPVYSTSEVQDWFNNLSVSFPSLIDLALLIFTLLGLFLFMGGIWAHLREERNASNAMAGVQSRVGVWMMAGGGALGSLGAVFLLLVRFMRV